MRSRFCPSNLQMVLVPTPMNRYSKSTVIYFLQESRVERGFEDVLKIEEKQYALYGDSRYFTRNFHEALYNSENMVQQKIALNSTTFEKRRVALWFFNVTKQLFGLENCEQRLSMA